MQISKTLLTCGAVALCLIATSARAADTDTDLQLREALRKKMAEVGPEPSDTAPSKPAPVKAPKPPKAPKAPKAPEAPKAPKAPAPEVSTKPAPVAPPVVTKKPVAPAPVVVQPAPVAAPANASPEQERLREAVRARLAEGETRATVAQPVVTNGTDVKPAASSTTTVAPAPTAAPSAPAPAPAPAGPVTLVAPPLPISGSKEQRLSALLQQYKADLITPQQYHEQRLKIMSE